MKYICLILWTLLALAPGAPAQTTTAPIQAEMNKLDALCADPDLKIAVVTAMADRLATHRNHLLLERRETGQSFATIFVAELRARGVSEEEIQRSLSSLLRQMDRRFAGYRPGKEDGKGIWPVLNLHSIFDHDSSRTLYSLVPEFGIDSRHAAIVFDLPYYRAFESNSSSGGLGDVAISGLLRGRAAGLEFGSGLTIGAPTGDKSQGLGAGKVTFDATGSVAGQFEFARPWISAGFANSVFNNAGYQRPYITDGNAAHFSGGVDFRLPRKLASGVAAFGLEPVGNQVVYSQTVRAAPTSSAGGSQQPGQAGGSGMTPGGSMGLGLGMGMGNGGGVTTSPAASMRFYDRSQQSIVAASELRDYGASVWFSVPIHTGFSLTTAVSRSIPFHLTNVRVALGVDIARLLFPGKHF